MRKWRRRDCIFITHQTFEVEEIKKLPSKPLMATFWWVFSELWTDIGTVCNRRLQTGTEKNIFAIKKVSFPLPLKRKQ